MTGLKSLTTQIRRVRDGAIFQEYWDRRDYITLCRVAISKRRMMMEEDAMVGADTEFRAHRHTLEMLMSFQSLGQILSVTDNEFP